MAKPLIRGPLPFKRGQPTTTTELDSWVSPTDDDEHDRVDGPRPAGSPSSSGGRRHIKPRPKNATRMLVLERVATSNWLWTMMENLEKFHNDRRPERCPGPERGYILMDAQIIVVAALLYDNLNSAVDEFTIDQPQWDRLREAVQAAFPNNPDRRLSERAPSRSQIFRAARGYFSGEALDELFRAYRRTAVKTAQRIGALDPNAGTWQRPAKSQAITGDKTAIRAATKHHYKAPWHPVTGELLKYDPLAGRYRTSDGGWSKIPGRELVMLSCRTEHPNERIPLDAGFMPRQDCPSREGRNEADHAVDMLKNLINENPTELRDQPGRPSGLKCFIHDMALDAEAIDRVLDMRLLPVAKVPKTTAGKCRTGTLGPHEFTTPRGQTEPLDVRVFNGSTWVRFPFNRHTGIAVPLHSQLYWGAAGKHRSILYATVTLPRSPVVPGRLRGATARVRFNSLPEEIHNDPHTRRTRMLRPIPEANEEFEIFGVREDIEALFGDLKYKLRHRLPSIHEDTNRHRILCFMILGLALAELAYERRIAEQDHKPLRKPASTARSHKPGSRRIKSQRRSAATAPQAVPIGV